MILFGSKTILKVLGTIMPYSCTRCSNTGRWKIIKQTRYFTLFFIPIFPFSTKYYMQCSFCNGVSKLSKADVDEYIQTGKDDFIANNFSN